MKISRKDGIRRWRPTPKHKKHPKDKRKVEKDIRQAKKERIHRVYEFIEYTIDNPKATPKEVRCAKFLLENFFNLF